MLRTYIVLLIVSLNVSMQVLAKGQDSEQVIMVYGTASKPADRKAARNFFHSALRAVRELKQWQVIDEPKITNSFEDTRKNNIHIPAIDRSEIIRGLEVSNEQQIIAEVQSALDTFLIRAAVLVDCELTDRGMVKGCALHYYDREKEKITASVEKKFSVPIKDATVWSMPLVARLQAGLAERKEQLERQTIDQFIADSESTSSAFKYFGFGLGVYGETGKVGSAGDTSSSGVYVNPYLHRKGARIGLTVGAGQGKDNEQEYASQHAALVMATQSHALESMLWDLAIHVGFAKRKLNLSYENEVIGRVVDERLFVAIQPGIFWEFFDGSTQLGLDFSFRKYFGGRSKGEGFLEGNNFALQGYNYGFSARYAF